MSIVAMCSGGLDSVTLAHKLAAEAALNRLVSFDYGQRHRKELALAQGCARALGVPHDVVDLTSIARLLKASALTDLRDVQVPDGHYTEETMRITVVPNRNAIMLAIAFGIAASARAKAVAAAFHSGDHFIYPDCRPDFVESYRAMQRQALDGLWNIELYAPFVHMTKADIVRIGAALEVPFAATWSCYKGDEVHCGRCGTCVERQEAFHLAGVDDPTTYADPDYWRQACGLALPARP